MSHWPYIVASYGLTLGGMGALVLVSWLRMRSAEGKAEALSRPFALSEVEKRGSERADARISTSLDKNRSNLPT